MYAPACSIQRLTALKMTGAGRHKAGGVWRAVIGGRAAGGVWRVACGRWQAVLLAEIMTSVDIIV